MSRQVKTNPRNTLNPMLCQVQTRLTHKQAVAFSAMMRKTGCTVAETARQLIVKGLEELHGVAL